MTGPNLPDWDAYKPFTVEGTSPWWASTEGIERVITQQQQIAQSYRYMRRTIVALRIQQRYYFLEWAKIVKKCRTRTRTLEARQAELQTLLREALEAADLARLILDNDGSIDSLRERLFSPKFIEQQVKRINRQKDARKRVSKRLKAAAAKANGRTVPSDDHCEPAE